MAGAGTDRKGSEGRLKMSRLSNYDYGKCDNMVQKINDFLEEFEADQDLTEAAFKFHIEWLFLKRRLKTFQRGLPKVSDKEKRYLEKVTNVRPKS